MLGATKMVMHLPWKSHLSSWSETLLLHRITQNDFTLKFGVIFGLKVSWWFLVTAGHFKHFEGLNIAG